jgi:zinc/manganese transport system substrate-binding protein
MTRTPFAAGAALAASALVLAGCSAPATPSENDSLLTIVASTNVYGDIAAAIGGDGVTVTSIIDSAAADPHSFEASARDQLAVSEADLIIVNGGGYDPFMQTLIEASGSTAVVLTAVEVAGLVEGDAHDDAEGEDAEDDHAADDDHADHDHIEGVNEHVWNDVHAMGELAHEIADELAELAPESAAQFEANAEEFEAGIAELEVKADESRAAHEGEGVALTEPVPAYLLEAAGFVNLTPGAFTEAIEEGADVPPVALQETLELIGSGRVVLLAYNSQTASPETERVREAAEADAIPVVDFTETLPEGQTYLSWMTANLDAIAAAVA